jgi:hypothetical protein
MEVRAAGIGRDLSESADPKAFPKQTSIRTSLCPKRKPKNRLKRGRDRFNGRSLKAIRTRKRQRFPAGVLVEHRDVRRDQFNWQVAGLLEVNNAELPHSG